jgi:hypothetical protein
VTGPNSRERRRDEREGTSSLHVSVPVDVPPERAAWVLGPGRERWLGELVAQDPEAASDRYLLDLELRVSDVAPRVAFHKAAYVDVGAAHADGERHWLEISWQAAGLAPLFPVFAGSLSWRVGMLELNGYYAPPGGSIGAVADRLLLNTAARATGRRLLERIAEVMTAA